MNIDDWITVEILFFLGFLSAGLILGLCLGYGHGFFRGRQTEQAYYAQIFKIQREFYINRRKEMNK